MGVLQNLFGKADQDEMLADYMLHVYTASHTGCLRTENQDYFYADGIGTREEEKECHAVAENLERRKFFAVFDGMGGEAFGAEASAIAAHTLAEYIPQLSEAEDSELLLMINRFADTANDRIQRMIEDRQCVRSGTTMVLVCMDDEKAQVFSIGDSRVYQLRNGHVVQITDDQTVAAEKLRANLYTEEEARISHDAHALTAYIGMDNRGIGLSVQTYPAISRFDPLLLCSDGLTDMCTDDQISTVLNTKPVHPAKALAEQAIANGGYDNVTCIVICPAEYNAHNEESALSDTSEEG
ncbi:MAG: protein phosphatase 2C domain-containing protein [Oscillospiraceae bacterium]|nr:protein phosphatase 2C domain-containing protein [Oscillospiraceae bacterium]